MWKHSFFPQFVNGGKDGLMLEKNVYISACHQQRSSSQMVEAATLAHSIYYDKKEKKTDQYVFLTYNCLK